MSEQNEQLSWWAGRDEEWLTVGPCETREGVIEEATGEFDGPFVVMQGAMHKISLSATTVLDHAYDHWADSDMFSHEHDAPEPRGSVEAQKAAEAELQTLLNAWIANWEHVLPVPNMFATTCNMETIQPREAA